MSHELDTDRLNPIIPVAGIGEVITAIGAQPWKQVCKENSDDFILVMTTRKEKEFLKKTERRGTFPEHFMATEIDAKKGKITTSDAQRSGNWQDWLKQQGFKEEFINFHLQEDYR